MALYTPEPTPSASDPVVDAVEFAGRPAGLPSRGVLAAQLEQLRAAEAALSAQRDQAAAQRDTLAAQLATTLAQRDDLAAQRVLLQPTGSSRRSSPASAAGSATSTSCSRSPAS